ncbi:MAG: hypothetical protein Q7R99_03835, partial [bacterium]|nr:hypothetical protein [bacterium]
MSFFKKFKPLILLISVFVVCYSVVFYVSAVWTDAPGTPTYCPSGTTGCDAPINAGPTPQYKTGSLGVGTAANPVAGNRLEVSGGQIKANSDLTVAGTSYFANVNVYGNMGIGTVSSPGAKLDVAGNIKARFFEAGEGASSTIATVPGWYRIASNSGNRANAEFTLRDYISGGGHSTLTFRVGVSYNFESGFSFTLLNHNYYNILTFTKVRILRNTVYDSQYLEVYVARAGNVDFSIYDNLQSTGWTPVAWTDGEIPVGYTAREFNVNNLFVVGDYTDRFTVNRGGNVGIGTATPGAKLEVAGQVKITGGTPGDGKVLTSDINGLATWQTLGSGGGVVSGTGTQNYVSKFNNAGGTAIGNSLIFDNGTNVGIGTASPLAKLEVATPATAVSTMNISRYAGGGYASIKSTDPNGYLIMDSNGQAVGLNWYTTDNVILANGGGNVGIGTAIPSELLDVRGILPKIQLYDTTGGAGYSNGWIGQNKVAQTLNFGVFDMLNPIMSLKYGGNVGIGTTAPGAKLEVAGQVKITGGTPGTGKVLTSDVSGLATWQTPAVAGVSSVFGRTGAVVAASGDYTTTLVTEGTSLYFTNARAVSAVQSLLDLKAPLASPTFTGNVTMPGTGVWNSSGNVGIGTINPGTNKLEVSGGQLKADNDLTVSGTSYFANVNAYGTINLLSDTWLTGAGRTIVRDSYFGYSSGYRATQLGADLSVRDIAIGVDPTSVAGGAFTGTGEIALPNLVEFMQKNSGGTNWLQDVLALNNGNVGIGTTNPGAKLEVAGQVKITGGTPGDGKVLTSDINGLATWQTLGAGGGVVSGTGTQNYVSKFNNAGGTTIGNSLIFDNGTNVGIGTTTPTSKLEITGGQIKANGDLTVIGTSYLANVRSGGYFYSTVSATDKFGNVNGSGWGVDALNNGNWDLLVYNGGSLYFNEAYFGYGGSATIRTYDTNENLAIMPNGTGNVGIGTTNPVAKLEVAGTAKMTGFQLGTSATAGQVLTTDASGVGT